MRVVVVPPAPALLPAYASLVDPVADLRAACASAVAWLGDPVRVVAEDDLGSRVGEALLGRRSDPEGRDLLVLANGSACRSERAPGHLDGRAAPFDTALEAMLVAGDTPGLARLDLALGRELLASGLAALAAVAGEGLVVQQAWLDHAEDPFGVMYWVVRWQCES